MAKQIKKRTSLKILPVILLAGILFSCGREYIKTIKVTRNFTGALWVVRNEIATSQKIDELFEMIEDTDIKHLFVQVRGRGDAYYSSEIEPKAHDVPDGFDPLAYILEKSKKLNIKIHAWVNVSFVLDPGKYPPAENHILAKNPHWLTFDYTGRSLLEYTPKEMKTNLVEGYFLDPAIPEVKSYTISIIRDIISRYDVDGVHLDFIRYPYSGYNEYYKKHLSDFGYNPVAREIFKEKHGIDPIDIDRISQNPEKELFDQFRRDQITEIVQLAKEETQKKNITLSAAVMPRYDYGRKVYFQDWPLWLEKGYLDLACVMSYTQSIETYHKYTEYAKVTGFSDKIFMGVMVNEKMPYEKIHRQIHSAYLSGMRGFILFSFKHDREKLRTLAENIKYSNKNFSY